MEIILCAAIHVKDCNTHENQPKNIKSGFVITGRRHFNCYYTLSLMGDGYNKFMIGREGQGFVTSEDRYVDRKEAYKIAFAADQITGPNKGCPENEMGLSSEDLY